MTELPFVMLSIYLHSTLNAIVRETKILSQILPKLLVHQIGRSVDVVGGNAYSATHHVSKRKEQLSKQAM